MPAEVGFAPPFHKGVSTLMNVGDVDDVGESCVKLQLLDVGVALAAGLWGYYSGTGNRERSDTAKWATFGLAAAAIATRVSRCP